MRLAIVGNNESSHIGGSLLRAALAEGHEVQFFNTSAAFAAPRWRRALSWKLLRRAPLLEQFSASVQSASADLLIVTGLAPLTAAAIRTLRSAGIRCVNYLTDDPWNPAFRAAWLLEAIAAYDHVFTPRRANIEDLTQLGCSVSYLPFGYDADLFKPAAPRALEADVFFAGHADADRFALLSDLAASELRVALYGRDWTRSPRFAALARGQLEPNQVGEAVAASAVALCPVRRANRDGHAMRSFELAAVRACILAEDTTEHRAIYQDTVHYFSSASDIVPGVRALLGNPELRAELAAAAHQRITQGRNTYRDRLGSMLSEARA